MTWRFRPTAALAAGCALAWSLAGSPALAQALGQGSSPDVPWWRVLGALVICLALAAGGAFALRHRLGGKIPALTNRKRRLELVETVRLSHQIDICLLHCDGADLIVAATPHGAVVLPYPGAARGEPTP